jgi:uncharacterized protein
MAQRAEYMNMSTSLADDETRKWIKFKARAESMDKSEKIKAIEDKLDSLRAQAAFKTYLTQAYHYGRGHLYLDTGDTDNPDELKTDLGGGGRSAASAYKMAGKKLIGLRPIEAVWCTPHDYETSDPLKPNWYEPQAWFAMSKQIHASRLLKIIPHPVSDLLKPAYSFGGVPLIQMAKPYVDNWLQTRQSVNDLIQSFSQWVLATNLDATLAGGTGDDVYARAAIFNNAKNSRGIMMIDKEKEDFKNVQTPLGGLDELQAQALEHICSAIRQPVVKYTGIDPQGLNASSEGSIRVYYDLIHSTQEYLIRPPLQVVVDLIQIELFGDVDPDILLEFEPLYEMTDIEKAQVRYQDAQTGALLIQSQVIDPQEERARVADDPDTPYVDLDPMAMPDAPQPDQHTDAWTKVFGELADNSGWAPVFGGLHSSGGMQPQAPQTPIARGVALALAHDELELARELLDLALDAGPPDEPRDVSSAKIGSGQGVQSYGYGLYLARNPEVAKTYRREGLSEAEYAKQPGNIYTVKVKADPDAFLDWDKPLSQQSAAIKALFRSIKSSELGSELPKYLKPERSMRTETRGCGPVEGWRPRHPLSRRRLARDRSLEGARG